MPMTETPRKTWTDERLDDLNAKVDAGFERVGAEIRDLRSEMGDLRSEMNLRFEAVDRRFADQRTEMNQRFEALNRNMWIGAMTIVAAVIGTGALG